MKVESSWIAVALFLGVGLWWILAPNATIGFCRAFGSRQFERRGPKGVRVLGMLPLTLGVVFAALLISQSL